MEPNRAAILRAQAEVHRNNGQDDLVAELLQQARNAEPAEVTEVGEQWMPSFDIPVTDGFDDLEPVKDVQ